MAAVEPGTLFEALVAVAALAGGVIASLAGFGIGSLITPIFAMRYGMKLAVAMVAVPHVAGTALRFWFLRRALDRHVMLTFGVTSALGGLTGAVLHHWIGGKILAYVLAALLIFAGITGLLGITLKFGRTGAWIAGALSGLLGGLVGNQGGIRAGAMLGFDVPKEAFVATATAVALLIDGARLPIYLYTDGAKLEPVWGTIAIATVAVLLGTLIGRLVLGRIRDETFKRVVSGLILLLGISMLFVALGFLGSSVPRSSSASARRGTRGTPRNPEEPTRTSTRRSDPAATPSLPDRTRRRSRSSPRPRTPPRWRWG
jgi:uncharacterized membrane protein YfcA